MVMKDQMMGGMDNKKYLEYSEDIHDSSSHLLQVISDILDISKIEAGELSLDEQIIDLPEVVESCCLLLADSIRQKNLRLNTDFQTNLPELRGDMTRIKQVIINFLSNATKFTPEGGKIYLICMIDKEGHFILSVKDSGIGIAQEDISRVLEPFGQVDDIMTRTHEGTGLGLSLCANLIDQHGGTMTLESVLGEGTTVTAIFPAWRVVYNIDEKRPDIQ
jgi:signal transduction histidine kinase